MDNNTVSIRQHEQGKSHKDLAEKAMNESRSSRLQREKESASLQDQFAAIEAEALRKAAQDASHGVGLIFNGPLSSEHGLPSASTSASTPTTTASTFYRPPPPSQQPSSVGSATSSQPQPFFSPPPPPPIAQESAVSSTPSLPTSSKALTSLPPGISAALPTKILHLPSESALIASSEAATSNSNRQTQPQTSPCGVFAPPGLSLPPGITRQGLPSTTNAAEQTGTASAPSALTVSSASVTETGFGAWEVVAPSCSTPASGETTQDSTFVEGAGRKTGARAWSMVGARGGGIGDEDEDGRKGNSRSTSATSAFGGSSIVRANVGGSARFDENDLDELEARRKLTKDDDIVAIPSRSGEGGDDDRNSGDEDEDDAGRAQVVHTSFKKKKARTGNRGATRVTSVLDDD